MSEYALKTKATNSFSCEGCLWELPLGECCLRHSKCRGQLNSEEMRESFGCIPGIKQIIVLAHKLTEQEVNPVKLVRTYHE